MCEWSLTETPVSHIRVSGLEFQLCSTAVSYCSAPWETTGEIYQVTGTLPPRWQTQTELQLMASAWPRPGYYRHLGSN